MTTQPKWKFIGNLGDANPLEYGGYFIFEDTTGRYQPEGEYYDPDRRTCYRITLDKLTLTPEGRLVLASLHPPLPHPIETYEEWFGDRIAQVAQNAGLTAEALRSALCSDDILSRAAAYENLASYFGWFEFDPDPYKLTEAEAEYRYDPIKLNGMTGE